MREFFKSGSVRGVWSNPHPYRDRKHWSGFSNPHNSCGQASYERDYFDFPPRVQHLPVPVLKKATQRPPLEMPSNSQNSCERSQLPSGLLERAEWRPSLHEPGELHPYAHRLGLGV